jgi:hypothetical protein
MASPIFPSFSPQSRSLLFVLLHLDPYCIEKRTDPLYLGRDIDTYTILHRLSHQEDLEINMDSSRHLCSWLGVTRSVLFLSLCCIDEENTS